MAIAYCYLAWGIHLKVPLIAVASSPLPEWSYPALGSPLNLATDASFALPYASPMTFFERLDNVYSYYKNSYSFSSAVTSQDECVEKYFGKGLPAAKDLPKKISLVLMNYVQFLHGLRAFAPMIVPIGGLHVSDTNETLERVCKIIFL